MSDSEQEPSQRTNSSHLLKTRLIGGISLALWGIAVGCLIVQAEVAYDPKALAFARGLLMLNLTVALLASLVWIFAKYYLVPLVEGRAIAEYAYRAGCRDTGLKLMYETELHLVRPTPPPVPATPSPLSDYFVKQNSHRTNAPT